MNSTSTRGDREDRYREEENHRLTEEYFDNQGLEWEHEKEQKERSKFGLMEAGFTLIILFLIYV